MSLKVNQRVFLEFGTTADPERFVEATVVSSVSGFPPGYRLRYYRPGETRPTERMVDARSVHSTPEAAAAASRQFIAAIERSIDEGTPVASAARKQLGRSIHADRLEDLWRQVRQQLPGASYQQGVLIEIQQALVDLRAQAEAQAARVRGEAPPAPNQVDPLRILGLFHLEIEVVEALADRVARGLP